MKKILFLISLGCLLPFSQAWGDTSTYYYAKMTASSADSGMGKVYAGTSKTDSPSYAATSSVGSTKSAANTKSVAFHIYAKAEPGYEFTGWTAGNATTLSDTSTSADKTTSYVKATVATTSTSSSNPVAGAVTAGFKIITYTEFVITYSAPENGSYTVDGTSVGSGGLSSGAKTTVYKPELIAKADSGYAFNGWYEDGKKVSSSATYTPSYTASHTVSPQFVKATVVTTLADLKTSVQSNPLTEVPSGTTIVIPNGDTVTVASGNTLLVNGTIFVEGTLNGSAGSVTVGGTLAKLTKSYVQKGQNGATGADAQPYNPYGTVKYWITSTETVSGVSVSGATASSFVRITNGKGTVYRAVLGTSDPVAIICTKDSSAVNLVTGITNTSQTSIETVLKSYTDKLHILCKDASDSSRTSKADYAGVTDLAGYKLTIGKKGINSYAHTILNGSYEMTIPSSTGGLYGTLTCIKCSAIKIANFVNKYGTTMNFYDCTPADYVTRFEVSTTGSAGNMNYYSGGPYPIGSIKTPVDIFHIYGGSWTGKPDDARIPESLKSDYKFYQHDDGYWYLELKGDEVMNVDGTEYKDLSAAIAAVNSALSSKSSVKMEMLKSATISTPFTVPSGKTLEIELAGCCITAPNGLVTNNGTFIIGDKYAGTTSAGARVVTSGGSWITNNGTADVTYGYYDGNITLNGGTFTTHHGYFTGTISGTAERAILKGGYFAQDVSAYLMDGYYRTDGYVGPFPKAGVSKTYTNSGYWKYTVTLLPSDDLKLYTNTKTEKSDYSDADWKRKAEIKSMVQPYLTKYTVDYTISFDRNVASGTVTANVEKPSIVGERTLDVAVEAAPKGLYRILSKELAEPTSPFLSPANQKWYADCFADSTFHEVVFGVYSSATDNQGTTADLRVDFCQGANGTDISKLTTKLNIASEYTVIGAGQTNQAMIQPASGKATFYATVAAAVDACAKGGTIKLCNDISGSISVGKECSLDVNGMNVTGDIAAAAGFTMSVSETTPDIEKYLGKNHKVYTFTPGDYTLTVPAATHTTVSVSVDDQVVGTEAKAYGIKGGQKVVVTYTAANGYELKNGTTTCNFVTGDIVVTAPTVSAKNYNITYNLDGGTNHADNPATYTIESETITLKAPTKTDYNFTGWTPEGTITKGSTGDKSFTAGWELALVTITIPDVTHMTKEIEVSDGEATHVSGTTYQVKPGVTVTVTYTAATGYEPASKVCVLENASKGATIPDVPTAKATTYAIAYYDGETPLELEPTSYTVEDKITLPTPEKTGYTFNGWYDNAELTGTTVTTIPAGSTGAKTFYSKWTPTNYTITYELNGGENDPANPATYTIESETITLKAPTKTDYNFTGWTPDNGVIAKGSTGDKTFTAGWELALVTITIPNVANTTNTIVVSEGEATRVEGNLYQVKPGVTVTVTYTAVGAFVPKTSVAKLENAKAGDTVDTSAIVIKPAVAKIDTTYYGTLPEALTAAKDDDTVVVLKGLVLDDPIAITTDTPAYTLDLNGHSVTGAIDLAANCTIAITNAYRGTLFDVMTETKPVGGAKVAVTTGVADPICFESLDDAYWATTNSFGQVALAAVSNPIVKDIYGDDVVYEISQDFKDMYQPTGEEIMRPDQPMENGMSAWQNDLLGKDPTDTSSGFYIDAPQNDKQDKVTISLQNADDVDGYWIQKPDGTEEIQQDVKDFDISITGADDPTGIYKVGAIVGNDDNTFVLTAPKTIVGLIKQVQNMEKAIIAVPWGSLEQGKNEIAVSNVVKTANLTAGDQLWVYRPGVTKEDEHETWTLQEEGGRKYWYPGNNVFGDNDVVKSGDPQSATIPKGSGIWLIRTSNLDKPYYLYGQATDEPSAVPLVKGANLVGATGADEYDINAHITGAQAGDQIQVPGADGKKTLMTFKGGEWTREEAVAVTFRGKTTYKNVTTNDCKAAVGTGFWLFNQGGNIQVK